MINLKYAMLALTGSLLIAGLATPALAGKPLKVFILAGDTQAVENAALSTLKGLAMDPQTKGMYDDLCDANGVIRKVPNVYISLVTELGNLMHPRPIEVTNPLGVGYGVRDNMEKIGVELSFGYYMQKHLNEPILIIKTTWRLKSLHTDFRPPSAEPFAWTSALGNVDDAAKEKKFLDTSVYYWKMIEHVKKVLQDPGKFHPAYDPAIGYELAGFIWFHGSTDHGDRGVYPKRNQPEGFNLYAELLAHLVRDVRSDLKASKMPFLIGEYCLDEASTPESEAAKPPAYRGVTSAFRAAQAQVSNLPEFKDNVIFTPTAPYWDLRMNKTATAILKAVTRMKLEASQQNLDHQQRKALEQKYIAELTTPEEIAYHDLNRSNFPEACYGSMKMIAPIGKAFADDLFEWHQKHP